MDGPINSQEKELEKYEEEILKSEENVVALEKKIEKEEKEILVVEGKIYKAVGFIRFFIDGFSKYEASFLRTGFAHRFSKHKLIYTLTILTSVVLIWRGIWALADATPGIANPIVSIILGIAVIWLVDSISELI